MTRRQQSLEERYANITRQMLAGTLGGRARAAAPVAPPLATLSTTRPRQAGGGKELATVVVAAADSHASGIASANYACDGVADEIEINQAIQDCMAAMYSAGSPAGTFANGTQWTYQAWTAYPAFPWGTPSPPPVTYDEIWTDPSPPWQDPGFDDISWRKGEASWYSGAGYATGRSTQMPGTVDQNIGIGVAARKRFRATADGTMTINISADDAVDGIWVDGVNVGTGSGSVPVVTGQTYLVAVAGHNGTGIFVDNWFYFDVTVNGPVEGLDSTRGGRVILLEGTFSLSARIAMDVSDVVLQGQGPATVVEGAGTSDYGLVHVTAARCVVRDMKVETTATTATDDPCIYIASGDDCAVHDVVTVANYCGVISDADGTIVTGVRSSIIAGGQEYASIRLNGSGGSVSDCYVEGGVNAGIALWGDHLTASGNVIVDAVDYGIVVDFDTCAVVGNVVSGGCASGGIWTNGDHSTVVGNVVSDVDYGIVDSGSFNVISYNQVSLTQYEGLYLAGNDGVARGNLIYGASQAAHDGAAAIRLVKVNAFVGADRYNVQANVVRYSDSALRPKYGVWIEDTQCDDNLVTNNDVRNGYQTAGISDAGTGTITAAGNRL